ncbi:hypothetical protein O6H91_07G131400 [Diphasiastrum complanatum]|nr:hypothetical protein O6H91_07G131400 [Diphasiastrum complanatum]
MMDWTDNHFRSLARLISRKSWLYTEMIVAETIVYQQGNLDRLLEFPDFQHPIALQLGGSNLENLAIAARLANSYGYDEINLNCGCPSSKVAGHGCFGARLMLDPVHVGDAMQAIASECNVPVTVKCRIGVDDYDSYDQLFDFVSTVSSKSPTQHFIIHARKALLKGLNPEENRSVPPLKYEYVFALIRDFPELQFTLNGGIVNIGQVKDALSKGAHGVMMGRAAYKSPWITLAKVDREVYGISKAGITRRQIIEQYEEYASSVVGKYGPLKSSIRHVTKPLLHFFHAEPGAGLWRRAVDESLRQSESFHELLKETLKVLPDSVLDSPPSYEMLDNSSIAVGPLPLNSRTCFQLASAL